MYLIPAEGVPGLISRKYASDYSIGFETGKNGKQREVAVYHGAYFSFEEPPEDRARTKRLYLLLGAVSLVLLLVLLWFTYLLDPEYRFLSLPMAFDLPCLTLVLVGVWRLRTAGERMTREQKDKLCNRLPPASLFFMILSVLCPVCCIVHMILCGLTLPMTLLTLDALALAAAAVLLFSQRRHLRVKQL